MVKYLDITRLKDKYATAFSKGEHIVVQVKIDGANSSIAYDEETNNLVAFSRKTELSDKNTLNGFWDFVQKLDTNLFKSVIGTRYIIFGEWTSPHSIIYPKEMYYNFYMFDVYDKETEQYLPQEESIKIFKKLQPNLKYYVKTLYSGEFISWEHIYSFLQSNLYGEKPCMEGIVIKSQDRLDNKFSGTPAYVKIVAKQFSEVHQSKTHNVNLEKMAETQAEIELVSSIVTERRVIKLLEKFVDEGVLPADYDEKNLKNISKILPRACFEDCKKEEPEIVNSISNFGKYCSKIAMNHALNIVGG